MQAIIMAGGAGTRLRPLTNDIPKPMVRVIDKPVLECIIRRLKTFGIYDIGVTLNYMPDAITGYFGDGKGLGVKIKYFFEDTPLGTAGGVKVAKEYLDENFLVVSGDAYSEIDFDAFTGFHLRKKQIATLAVKRVKDVSQFGVVKTEKGIITEFVEKPQNSSEKMVNTGIYMFKRDILQLIPDGFYDFGRDLFPQLVGKMAAYETKAYWSDIGTLERYYKTNLYVAGKAQFDV